MSKSRSSDEKEKEKEKEKDKEKELDSETEKEKEVEKPGDMENEREAEKDRSREKWQRAEERGGRRYRGQRDGRKRSVTAEPIAIGHRSGIQFEVASVWFQQPHGEERTGHSEFPSPLLRTRYRTGEDRSGLSSLNSFLPL